MAMTTTSSCADSRMTSSVHMLFLNTPGSGAIAVDSKSRRSTIVRAQSAHNGGGNSLGYMRPGEPQPHARAHQNDAELDGDSIEGHGEEGVEVGGTLDVVVRGGSTRKLRPVQPQQLIKHGARWWQG